MRRKLLILVAALGLVVGLAPAATAAPGKYAYDCDLGSPNNAIYYAHKDVTGLTTVIGTTTVIPLQPCFHPDNPAKVGGSYVMAANLQQLAGATPGMVQLGYGQVDCPSGYTCTVPDDGLPHFVWTPDDSNHNGCGAPGCLAQATWAGQPIIGHQYQFKVQQDLNPSGQPAWRWWVTDLTAIPSTSFQTLTPRTWGNSAWGYQTGTNTDGRSAWWGFETMSTADAMGRTSGTTSPWTQGYYGDEYNVFRFSPMTCNTINPRPYYFCLNSTQNNPNDLVEADTNRH